MMGALRGLAIGLVILSGMTSSFQTPARDASTPSTTGTSGLSGVVVNDVTDRPVRRAVVTIYGGPAGVRLAAVTDDDGTFSFTDLPADRYSLGAYKAGFVSVAYGAKRYGRPGTAIALDAGQQKTDLTLRLVPGAILTGTVRDGTGEPLAGARVVVLRPTFGYDTGERTLSPVAGGFGELTDDRGVYRVYGLPPDDYFVVATTGSLIRGGSELRETTASEIEWATRQLRGQSGPAAATDFSPAPAAGPAIDYAPVFYPGVYTQAQATSITLKEGEERGGVDVMVGWTRTAKITGAVVSPGSPLPSNLQVNVIAHDTIPGIPFSGFGDARVADDGAFVSAGLPPGDYTVTVRVGGGAGARGAPPPQGAAALFGTATVAINGVDTPTTVTLQTGVTVSGRLIFEADTAKPPSDLSRQRVSLTPVRTKVPALGVAPATVDAAGAFTFRGVAPGRYRINAFISGGWQLQSAIADGRDIADFPLEVGGSDVRDVAVRFTDRTTEISGDLLNAGGQPASEYFIIAFATDKSYWTPQSRRIQSTRPGADGHFKLQNLPPGEYYIGAVNDVEQGEWYDPSFLAQLVGASQKLTLADGEKKVQNLKLAK